MRGGEKVLEEILGIFPDADIFTLICDRNAISDKIKSHRIKTSFLQAIPGIFGTYRNFLPLFPAAIGSFNMKGYDLIISSSHCVAKSVKPGKGSKHFCYCHTPMRYAWDQFHNYFSPEKNGGLKYALISFIMPFLRKWDRATAGRVDHYMANSTAVQGRIKKYYGRESTVVHPPVDTDFYTPGGDKEGYCLMVSALTEYKKVDSAAMMFRGIPGERLVIIGKGPLLQKIKNEAGPNILVRGYCSNEEIRDAYRKAKVFIFPGEEDFGITMAESLACSTPVLAYEKGGSRDIVEEGATGEFFDGTKEGFIKTLEKISNRMYDKKGMRESSLRFSKKDFRENFTGFLRKNGINI